MALKLLILLAALVGMTAATGPANAPADGAHAEGDDLDAGWRGFGKVVSGFTVLAGLIVALIFVLMILAVFGVFEHEAIDPPV